MKEKPVLNDIEFIYSASKIRNLGGHFGLPKLAINPTTRAALHDEIVDYSE